MAEDNNEVGYRSPAQSRSCIRNGPTIIKVLAVVCVLLLIACIALIVFSVATKKKLNNAEDVCESKECIISAARLLENLNASVSPCDDFYQFSCGGYIKKNDPLELMDHSTLQQQQVDIRIELKKLLQEPITPKDSGISIKTKNLYKSCMNVSLLEDSMEVARNLLESVGRWPMVDDKWREREFDLEGTMALLYAHGGKPFFQTNLIEDSQNKEGFLLNIFIGDTILPSGVYLNDENPDNQKYLHHYKKIVKETTRLFGADESVVSRDYDDMLQFEKDLAHIIEPFEKDWAVRFQDRDTVWDAGLRCNTSLLREVLPEMKWDHFFSKIFDYFKLSLEKREFNMLLQNRNFFKTLTSLIKRTPNRTMANYLTWGFVLKTMPYLDVHFRRLYVDFARVVPLERRESVVFTRWSDCVDVVLKYFHIPMTALYMREHFNRDENQEVKELVGYLKGGYVDGIRRQDWLDDETKKLVELKLENMKSKISVSKYLWKHPEELEKAYSAVNIRTDRYLSNILGLIRHNVATDIQKMTGAIKREDETIERPLDVSAYYMPPENTLYVPIAMMRYPVFVSNRPKYMNFGMLGMFLGHEIGHGFDTVGFMYGPNGEMGAWKPGVVEKFAKKAKCFAEQYSGLRMEEIDMNVDGDLTINENIADNAAIRNALKAYNTYVSEHSEEPKLPGVPYSAQQIYFIEYAQSWCQVATRASLLSDASDEHTTAEHRVKTPLMNSPEFSELFQCPLGSPMNPVKKCDLWA